MEERRSAPRRRTLKGAKIVINDGFSTFDCTVRNLSDLGANLRVPSIVGIPDSFRLIMSDGQAFDCKAVWKRESEIGVSFV